MARQRMVTRTIEETTVTVMGMSISEASVETRTYVMGQFSDDESLLKAVKARFETDDFKIVTITNKEVSEVLYGMPEEEFIQYAKVLPPRTKTE